ncbi:MAG: histidine--tRNA ligase, partial [Sphingorhabdus sp.]
WQQHMPLKLSAHGPLFRYERPQKGRYRQFHQLDAEIIGASEPAADVELLCFADQLLKELGIDEGVTLQLNTLGDAESRDAWRAALVEHFSDHQADLSDDSKTRLEKNPLRILDSKAPNDRAIVATAPPIDPYLTAEASEFFAQVTEGLDSCNVAWKRDANLVRGFDYYRHTAFEFIPEVGSAAAEKMGSQSTILGGGRFDGLMEALGGPHTPAVGWAAGIERLGMLLDDPEAVGPDAIFIPLGDGCEAAAMKLMGDLRRSDISCEMAYKGNMKKRMQKANAAGAAYVVIIGESELANGVVALKNLETGDQQDIALNALAGALSA